MLNTKHNLRRDGNFGGCVGNKCQNFPVIHVYTLLDIVSTQTCECVKIVLRVYFTKVQRAKNALRNNESLFLWLVSIFIEQIQCEDNDVWNHFIRIEEPWLTGNAVISLIAKCLNLQPHIREIRCSSEAVPYKPHTHHVTTDNFMAFMTTCTNFHNLVSTPQSMY